MKQSTSTVAALLAALLLSVGAVAQDRTTTFTFTGYPRFGAVATPNDGADLSIPGYVRANQAGAVRAACDGNGSGSPITVDLAIGEFFPCLVIRLYDTGTDSITLHVFY